MSNYSKSLRLITALLLVVVLSLGMLSSCKRKTNTVQGEQGIPGERGEDGNTPYIGENGNWWISGVDTGVQASAKNGEDGADGVDGASPSFEFNEDEKILYLSYDNGYTWSPIIDLNGLYADGITPQIKIDETSGEWMISYDRGDTWEALGIIARGEDGTNGQDGKDGANGKDGADGITPQLRINEGIWEVSYDNCTSWISLGVRAVGENGADGKDGQNGIDGTDGKDGEDGKDGKDGITPEFKVENGSLFASYDKGESWNKLGDLPTGADGADGEDGQNGKDGTDGITPQLRINEGIWEVSYDNCTSWISLGVRAVGENGADGKDGQNGIDGTDGKDGEDGKDGKDGITPEFKVENGSLFASYDKGESWNKLGDLPTGADGADGEDGKDGKNGQDGKNGADGVTPLLRITEDTWEVSYDNGASWTSLGVKASGSDGEDGKDGQNGADGKDGKDGRGVSNVEIIDGNLYITYTDNPTPVLIGAIVSEDESGKNDVDIYTDSLAFYPLGDGSSYGVKVGCAEYLNKIIIPSTYNGKPVTTILERGFTNVVSATTIIIPDSITEIQSEAFSGCKNLTGLFIPASVTTIGDLAFAKVPNVHFEIKESEVPDTWTALLGNTNSYWGATREE